MKKFFAILIAAVLALGASAFAATYTGENIAFEYNDEFFDVSMDDHTGDEDLVILSDKYEGGVSIHLAGLKDGETFPTAEDVAKTWGVEPETMDEWGNFKDVLCFDLTNEDGAYDVVFLAPVYAEDGAIDGILSVNITGKPIEDEDAAMESSDWTSEVVDTLKVLRVPQGYGVSELYTADELAAAADLIRQEFASFEGCELHSLRYVGDACNTAKNIQWMNSLDEGKGFTQVAEFLSDFHSPVNPGEQTVWEADKEYTDYEWWLARAEGGEWQLLTMGY